MDRALKTVIGQLKPGLPRSGRSDRPRYSFPIARTVMQRLRLSDRSSLIRLGFTTCSATSRNSSRTAMSSISESCRRMVAPWRKKTVSTTQSAAETFGSIHGKSVRRTALQSIKLLVCAISASGSSEQLPLEDPQRSCTHQTNTSATSACEEGRTSAAKLARTCASSLKRDAATPMKSWPPPHRAAEVVPAWHVQLARQHRLG
jgi:hypothetical protein